METLTVEPRVKTLNQGLVESIARTMNISWEQAADILNQLERNPEPGCKVVDEQGQVISESGIAITDAVSAAERRREARRKGQNFEGS